MPRLTYIIMLAAVSLLYFCPAQADEKKSTPTAVEHINIVDQIEENSDGNITIQISEGTKKLLDFAVRKKKETKKRVEKQKTKSEIWTIQVFSDGSDQRTLKARASARASAVLSRFPKYGGQVTYVYQSPKIRCRVGYFPSKEEATKVLGQMRGAFPRFAGELMIVRIR